MSADRFRAYREKMFRLYGEGRYGEALVHLNQGAHQFPQKWTDIAYWGGCLAARMGDIPKALKTLDEAVERGWWWSESGSASRSRSQVTPGAAGV